MSKHTKTVFSVVIIFIIIGYFTSNAASKKAIKFFSIDALKKQQKTTTSTKANKSSYVTLTKLKQTSSKKVSTNIKQKIIIPTNWKTYKSNKLGITFKYPDTWIKIGNDAEVFDRTGTVIAININFTDSLSNTTLLVEYHLAPYGVELYNFAVSEFKTAQSLHPKENKQIIVAGNKAIETFSTITRDGKGNAIKTPLKIVVVNFLDKQQTGGIRMQLNTIEFESTIKIANFEKLLSTFKFIMNTN